MNLHGVCLFLPVGSAPEDSDLIYRSDNGSGAAIVWRHRRTGIAGLSLAGSFDGYSESTAALTEVADFLASARFRLLVWDLTELRSASAEAIGCIEDLQAELCAMDGFEGALVVGQTPSKAHEISVSLRGWPQWTRVLDAIEYLYINQWQA